jgi:ubiquinone biosynthesis protein
VLLAPKHLSKFATTIDLFTRFGLAKFAREQGLDPLQRAAHNDGEQAEASAELAEKFRKRLVELGPAYIKLGQLLASRTDLLPATYIAELQKLEDDVTPAPYDAITEIIQRELGARVSNLFLEFSEKPLGSASLGQVHAATLRDGREVVVKVQRPDIREQIAADVAYFREFATWLTSHTTAGRKMDLVAIISQLEQVLADELDYRVEARNTEHFDQAMKRFPLLSVPNVIPGLSTERVLTMERMHGTKVTAIAPVVRTEVDLSPLADELVRAYMQHIAIDGHFHADPHPGNIFVIIPERGEPTETKALEAKAEIGRNRIKGEIGIETEITPEPARLAIIDFGMTARLTPALREASLRVLYGLAEDRGDDVADALIDSGEKLADFNRLHFVHDISQIVSRSSRLSAAEMDAGTVLYDILNSAMANGLRPAAELTMLAKALAQLGNVTRTLDPEFRPLTAVKRSMSDIATQQARAQFNPRRVWHMANEAAALASTLPRRIDMISKNLANNEFQIKHEMPQIAALTEGLQKVANRVLCGLVLAGLLVASALLMPRHNLLGTSGFVIAGVIALYMVGTIIVSDYRARTAR